MRFYNLLFMVGLIASGFPTPNAATSERRCRPLDSEDACVHASMQDINIVL